MITIRQVVHAGILQVPPIMLKQAVKWAQSVYAGQLLVKCDAWQKRDPLSAMAVRAEAEKYVFGGNRSQQDRERATTTIKYDLRGWGHEHLVEDKANDGAETLRLTIKFRDHPDGRGGHFSHDKGVFVFAPLVAAASVEAVRTAFFNLGRVMRHEMQHFTQALLNDLLMMHRSPRAGIPHKPHHALEPPIAHGRGGMDHALRGIEFYPRLSDEIDRFLWGKTTGWPRWFDSTDWKAAAAIWVGAQQPSATMRVPFRPAELFTKLKAHNRKLWQKACKVFYEAVASGNTRHTPAELEALIPPDMW